VILCIRIRCGFQSYGKVVDHYAIILFWNLYSGKVVSSGWFAHGGELHVWLQQLHVCLWPGMHIASSAQQSESSFILSSPGIFAIMEFMIDMTTCG